MDSEQLDQGLGDQEKLLLLFGYLGPLALVSLVASRREFVKWHAKQGIVLSASVVVLFVVLRGIQAFLDRFFWSWIGELFRAGVWLTLIGVVVATLVCIIRGLEGERFRLPLLGELADRL